MSTEKVFLLKCPVQTYAWGRLGSDSEVARLSKASDATFDLQEETPYAELWMGTHPKGPAVITSSSQSGTSLADWISVNGESLGQKVKDRFKGQLPYLFKVLSVNKALSIQAHPNKNLAEQLHLSNPDKYPDANHKPEMAIALTEFEGMCGFRPLQEIAFFMQTVPEFAAVVNTDVAQKFISTVQETKDVTTATDLLKQSFTNLMNCDPSTLSEQLERVTQRFQTLDDLDGKLEKELLLRLNQQFPGDVGIFCVFFLNHMRLQPGEAMFLEANLPHAYLSGNCIETMACSDNVVRAGLTPKFKDVPNLCSMLKYESKTSSENMFQPQVDKEDPCVTIYNPPVPDFAVARVRVPSGTKQYTMAAIDSASLVLVVEGKASGQNRTLNGQPLNVSKGSVIFISAKESVDLTIESTSEGLLVFRAFCEL